MELVIYWDACLHNLPRYTQPNAPEPSFSSYWIYKRSYGISQASTLQWLMLFCKTHTHRSMCVVGGTLSCLNRISFIFFRNSLRFLWNRTNMTATIANAIITTRIDGTIIATGVPLSTSTTFMCVCVCVCVTYEKPSLQVKMVSLRVFVGVLLLT